MFKWRNFVVKDLTSFTVSVDRCPFFCLCKMWIYWIFFTIWDGFTVLSLHIFCKYVVAKFHLICVKVEVLLCVWSWSNFVFSCLISVIIKFQLLDRCDFSFSLYSESLHHDSPVSLIFRWLAQNSGNLLYTAKLIGCVFGRKKIIVTLYNPTSLLRLHRVHRGWLSWAVYVVYAARI